MEAASACPKCGYARKATDTAPAWQCPSCHIAIEKFRAAMAAAAAPTEPPVAMQVVPPPLPFERLLASAAVDIAMAALFLWCWMKPLAWRPTLTADLGLLMLMEFFVVHSSIFLVAAGRANIGHRLSTALIVMLFYIPVAGAFAWWHGGWWPVLGFAALLGSRVATMLAGQGTDTFEHTRGQYYWICGAGNYIIALFLAVMLLPLPELGFRFWRPPDWTWKIPPQEVMAWGFLYFAIQVVTKLLEKPHWILQWAEQASTSAPAE